VIKLLFFVQIKCRYPCNMHMSICTNHRRDEPSELYCALRLFGHEKLMNCRDGSTEVGHVSINSNTKLNALLMIYIKDQHLDYLLDGIFQQEKRRYKMQAIFLWTCL
jgi:hypothetical protein